MKKILPVVFDFIILFSFFKPGYFEEFPKVNTFFNIFTIICSLIALILYLKNNKISKLQLLIITYILILLLSTAINGQDIVYFFTQYIPIAGISLFTEYAIKKDSHCFFKAFSLLMFLEILFNTISVYLFPYGMYGTGIYGSYDYFMGYDNYSAEILVIGLGMIFLNSYINKNKIGVIPILASLLMIYSYFTTKPATPLFALIIEILLMIIAFTLRRKKSLKFINYKLFLIIWIILFLALIVFQVQDLFSWLIVDIMNKDLTFTGRTFIWERCFDYFASSPIFGNGVINFNVRTALVGIYHAHSTILNVLIEGGLIGLIVYFSILMYAGKGLKECKDKSLMKIVTIMFFAIFILKLMDVFKADSIFYVLIITAYHSKDIILKKRREKNESIAN